MTNAWRGSSRRPIQHEHGAINELFRAAICCVVTGLQDGMDLMRNEFVAARHEIQGVLVLAQFAGAARETSEAPIENPCL